MEKKLLNMLNEQLDAFINFLPNLAGALAVLIGGWIVAKLLARVIKRALRSIGADKLAEKLNEIDLFYKSNIKIVPSMLLSKLVYYLLMFLIFIAATDVLGMQSVSDMMAKLLNYLPQLLSAFLVFIVGVLAADFLKNIVKSTCDSLGIPAAGVISSVVFYFVFINVVMITLSQAGINTEFIESNLSIIIAGVVLAFAIGYGLASRNIVANFLASFYNKNKIKVGDKITINGLTGEVIELDHTAMVLQSEGKRIIIPLNKLTSDPVEIHEK
jgi:small-conductance mechanosensitive channel